MTTPGNGSTALVRKELRNKLLVGQKAKTELIKVFGQEIELRQPSLGTILETRMIGNAAEQAVEMIIRFAYVPGTDELLFEAGDAPQLLKWPFGEDVLRLQEAIGNLTGLDLDGVKEEIKGDPLDEGSSVSAKS